MEGRLGQWIAGNGAQREAIVAEVNDYFMAQGMYTTRGVDRPKGASVSVSCERNIVKYDIE